MKTRFIDHPITYDGTQLRSHWILKQTDITGDAIVAFHGPCDVKTEALVDLHDRRENAVIYSENMVHIIAECFDTDLERMVLRQRLLIALLKEIIESKGVKNITRRGDDIFINNRKLTVSIATVSPVSALIHIGINISSKNTPVPAIGLKDLSLDQLDITREFLDLAVNELEGVTIARSKVTPVH